ncbi:MAG: hypothetical protein HYW05_02845 [Candidatus Diapherotrites archaeon]|nr:hypothetical protein [Candidatus Diapherotrites archaeon]
MDYGKIFLIAVLAALLIALAFGAWAIISQQNYQKAVSAENPEDICKAPAGYTQEQWEEHMGHHPDRYAQCLGSGR